MSTMVMTGGTSGFGAIAAEQLRSSGDTRLILGARRPQPLGESVALDLTSLESVRSFASEVRSRLGGSPIDALVLNAGVVRRDVDGRTADGFETTFGVNHLAHYLLLRLLLADLAEGATVVVTTSGTHDPATGGLTPPRHADALLLAYPERDPGRDDRPRKAGEQAYTSSKLCTVLTARSLAEQPDIVARGVTPLAYCPGQVFGTGLAQDLPIHMRAAWAVLGTPLGWPARRFGAALNTRPAAGNTLADLARGVPTHPEGAVYTALRRGRLTWPRLSDLASRDDLAKALWNDSASLVGLPA